MTDVGAVVDRIMTPPRRCLHPHDRTCERVMVGDNGK